MDKPEFHARQRIMDEYSMKINQAVTADTHQVYCLVEWLQEGDGFPFLLVFKIQIGFNSVVVVPVDSITCTGSCTSRDEDISYLENFLSCSVVSC